MLSSMMNWSLAPAPGCFGMNPLCMIPASLLFHGCQGPRIVLRDARSDGLAKETPGAVS